ncbi:HAD family hydrolase [Deinococcus deserti]|uniref:Putative haloacid dehalogenase-like hydrolase (HAD superfamily hydrolase) n=1 Tax=Deinococcus deserti (strain DSM 17065 / CIP 109153 / LMG 22923 / VCD115) TaxID=546414 RepID=C1CV93_DEIDV|nr:HAD family phosphatase [Deinococcus deserti]ACO46110.1 putative haloacid dehalogenase-like hydrolase (HAD superfamily hydrolase) [Deinococcus deserti VCD115]
MTDSKLPTRHVAFDWGGVFTVGTFDGRSTQNLADLTGVPVERVRESYFRHVRQLEVGAWTLPHFWTVMQEEAGLPLPYGDFEALYLGSVLDNLPMYDTLAALPAEVQVGLLSNNYPVVSDHLRRDARFGRFDALVFSNEIGHKKPAPEAFAALEAAMGVPASQVAFVDDVQENIDAANAAGFYGLLYHHDHHADFEARLGEWLNTAPPVR